MEKKQQPVPRQRAPKGIAQQVKDTRDEDWATMKLAETLCRCQLMAAHEARMQEMARRLM